MIELERQLRAMLRPEKWKRSPFLPLVQRKDGKEDIGFLYFFNKRTLRPDIYLGSMYHERKEMVPLTSSEVQELTVRTYPNFSAIIYDGWEVIDLE